MFGHWASAVLWKLVLVLGGLDAFVLDLCDSGDPLRGCIGWASKCCEDEEWRGNFSADEERRYGGRDAELGVQKWS